MELTERALARRLKRHLLKETQQFLAVCTPGFEAVLERELAGLPDVSISERIRGGALFTGPLDSMYHANLWLRTANRVLLRLGDFLAQSYPMLFDHGKSLPWELHLGFAERVALRVSAKKSRLRHRRRIAETLHSAMSRRLEPLGLRPVLDDKAPTEIFVRVFEDRATVSLNTSGEHLHRRGYRKDVTPAPIRETLAAGILMAAGLEGAGTVPGGREVPFGVLIDPMCGSGTFLIEAALLAGHVAPGLFRSFAFEHLPYFQASKWQRFLREAMAGARTPHLRILGMDIDSGALEATRANAERAGVLDWLVLMCADVRSLDFPALAPGAARYLLVANLPYGRRLGTEADAKRLAVDFCHRLRDCCHGWDFALVTAQPAWLQGAGCAASEAATFENGGLRTSLLRGVVG